MGVAGMKFSKQMRKFYNALLVKGGYRSVMQVIIGKKNPYTCRDASVTWEVATTIKLTTIHLDPSVWYDCHTK